MTWQNTVEACVKPIIEGYEIHTTTVLLNHCDHFGRLKLNSLVTLALSTTFANDELQRQGQAERGIPGRWIVGRHIHHILKDRGYVECSEAIYKFVPRQE